MTECEVYCVLVPLTPRKSDSRLSHHVLTAETVVRTPNRQPRCFSLYHAKRYEPERLAESLTRMGWDLVERWPFGEPHSPRALLLLQKRA